MRHSNPLCFARTYSIVLDVRVVHKPVTFTYHIVDITHLSRLWRYLSGRHFSILTSLNNTNVCAWSSLWFRVSHTPAAERTAYVKHALKQTWTYWIYWDSSVLSNAALIDCHILYKTNANNARLQTKEPFLFVFLFIVTSNLSISTLDPRWLRLALPECS